MNSRERVITTLNHQEPDRVPLDLGTSPVTGMHVQTVYNLRQALSLDPPGTHVKIIEPYQNLGEIKSDLIEILGVDIIGINPPHTLFGFKNENWVDWTFGPTPVQVPIGYNTEPEGNGDILMYPEGNKTYPSSGIMSSGDWTFKFVSRQTPIVEEELDPADNIEEFEQISDDDLDYFQTEIERVHTETDKAIMVNFGGMALGDVTQVPAPWLKEPKGIRDVEEWNVSTVTRRDYVNDVFDRQCDIAIANLERIYVAVEDKVTIIFMSAADFGTETGLNMSRKAYRELYFPHQKRLNDWVHRVTPWKTFMHSRGSIRALIPDLIEAGFDIISPIEWTATDMAPESLKSEYGDQVTFWGAGVDTGQTLPGGTPQQVRAEVMRALDVFGPGGGYVFNQIHNVPPSVPVENVLAMYKAFWDHAAY